MAWHQRVNAKSAIWIASGTRLEAYVDYFAQVARLTGNSAYAPERATDSRMGKARRSGRAATRGFLPNLKQDIVFCFDWFEVGLLAEHDPHLYLNSPRNK
jgi:hypothetical protein